MVRKNKSTGLKHTVRSSLKANREDNMKKSRIREAGKRAHENGLSLEQTLEALTDYYQFSEVFECEWVRNYEAVAKSKGRGEYNSGISSCDFTFYCGKTLDFMSGMVEAKARNGNRINKNALSVHQRKQLWRLEKLGHYGFICVSLVDPDNNQKVYLVHIKNWFRGQKKSHNCEDLDKIGYLCNMVLDPATEMLLPDVLEVFRHICDNGLKEVPKEYKGNQFNKKPYDTIHREYEEIYGEMTLDVDLDD